MATKIYTKKGDDGQTYRASGKKTNKNSVVISLNGKIDFVSSYIGLARAFISESKTQNKEILDILEKIQKQLFALGTDISANNKETLIKKEDVLFLEKNIDEIQNKLNPLKAFILPGGSKESSFIHLARCATRQAEIELYELCELEKVSDVIKQYINRLSDFLFVLARYLNNKGKGDILA